MDIKKEMTDHLQGEITLKLNKDDYLPKVNKELTDLRRKAQFKGFRKGHTPMSMVRKLHGQSVMVDIINKLVQEHVFKYIESEKLEIVGYPLPSEKQQLMNFNLKSPEDMEFVLDFGLIPDVEVAGVSETDEYVGYDIEVATDVLDEELNMARKRFGNEVHPESDILESDAVVLNAVELDGDKPKENGWDTGFKVLLSTLVDEYRETLIGKDVGYSFDFDIHQLEKDRDEAYVNKYLLNLDEEEDKEIGNMFRGTVEEISRIETAELDEEFFDKAFGPGNVKSEEEARDFFRNQIKGFYGKQSDELLFNNLYLRLLEENNFELPEVFLRRWVNESREQKMDDHEFGHFLKSYRWTVVRTKLNKMLGVSVNRDDIKAAFKAQIGSYMQGYAMDESFYDSMVERMMDNKEEVEKQADKVAIDKLFVALKNRVTVKAKSISLDDFKKMIDAENKRVSAHTHDEEE